MQELDDDHGAMEGEGESLPLETHFMPCNNGLSINLRSYCGAMRLLVGSIINCARNSGCEGPLNKPPPIDL